MKIIAGVDIGGTNTVVGLVSSEGDYLAEDLMDTNSHENIEYFLPRLYEKIEKMLSDLGGNSELYGIGIAAPCGNFYKGTIDDPSNIKWGNVNVVDLLKRQYSIPIVVTNDANAAALGEAVYGNAVGMNNFVLLTLGTGLGSGVYIDGKILNGSNGLAGELGHTIVEPYGRKCSCGNNGCLETYISANGLKRTVAHFLSISNEKSELRSISFNDLTGSKISELALNGDKIALMTYELTGEVLGRALSNIVLSFDPEAVILFGGLAEAGELLLEPTRRYFEENVLGMYKGKVEITKSKLSNGKAAVLGVSTLVKNHFELNGTSSTPVFPKVKTKSITKETTNDCFIQKKDVTVIHLHFAGKYIYVCCRWDSKG